MPVIAGVFRMTLNWTGPNGHAANVLHVRNVAGTPGGANTALDTNATAAMWTLVANTAVVTSVECLPLDGVGSTVVMTPTAARWTGQAATEANQAVSALISLRTGLRGSRHRGRLYLPYIAEGVVTTGFVNGGSLTTTQTAWNTFRTAMAASSYPLVVASYAHADANDVSQLIAESPLATQRRRQDRLR